MYESANTNRSAESIGGLYLRSLYIAAVGVLRTPTNRTALPPFVSVPPFLL